LRKKGAEGAAETDTRHPQKAAERKKRLSILYGETPHKSNTLFNGRRRTQGSQTARARQGANAGPSRRPAAGRGEGTQPRRHRPGDRPRKLPAQRTPTNGQKTRKQRGRTTEPRSPRGKTEANARAEKRPPPERQKAYAPLFSLSFSLSSLNSPRSFATYMAESGRDMAERTGADPVAGGSAQKEHTTAAAKAQAETRALTRAAAAILWRQLVHGGEYGSSTHTAGAAADLSKPAPLNLCSAARP
jgi:hypothetical protein